jgi:hypothetical protein
VTRTPYPIGQPSLFPERPQTPSGARHVVPEARSSHVATVRTPSLTVDFHDWSPLGPPLPFESIPAECRLPGEPGYIEMDHFMRPAGVKGGAA